VNEHAIRQSSPDKVCVLIHRQYRHPVSRVIAKPDLPIDLADRVGKRPSTGNDEQRHFPARGGNLSKDSVQALAAGQQTAAHLYDYSDSQFQASSMGKDR
jgi:hypothetical protein